MPFIACDIGCLNRPSVTTSTTALIGVSQPSIDTSEFLFQIEDDRQVRERMVCACRSTRSFAGIAGGATTSQPYCHSKASYLPVRREPGGCPDPKWSGRSVMRGARLGVDGGRTSFLAEFDRSPEH